MELFFLGNIFKKLVPFFFPDNLWRPHEPVGDGVVGGSDPFPQGDLHGDPSAIERRLLQPRRLVTNSGRGGTDPTATSAPLVLGGGAGEQQQRLRLHRVPGMAPLQ